MARLKHHKLKKRKLNITDLRLGLIDNMYKAEVQKVETDLYWFQEFCNFVDSTDQEIYDSACKYANEITEKK